jgi:DNA polymerase III subunit epsilon
MAHLPMVFVDLETTGATASTDRITEIGIVEVSENGVSEWSTLVNPEAPIPPFIERMTGISNEMVASAPRFAQLADEVLGRLQGRMFIAHNARFDYGFLKQEFRRVGVSFRATVLCTVKLSRKLYPQHFKHNLDSLIERHGLYADGRHRALADAQLIHQFWQRASHEFPAEHLAEMVRTLTAGPTLPRHIDPSVIDDLPESHGVYVFYGEDEQALFVSKSQQVKKSVLAHFVPSTKSTRNKLLTESVRRIEWEEAAGELGAQLREASLIRRLQPSVNARSSHHRELQELCSWQLVEVSPPSGAAAAQGYWQPQLRRAREDDIDFGRAADLYGLFANKREATRALAEVARQHQLCLVTLGLEKALPGKPCSGHPQQQCKGVCIGKEAPSFHSARLMAALGRLKLRPWPFPGPAVLAEGEDRHVIDGWAYLGTARNEADLWSLCETTRQVRSPRLPTQLPTQLPRFDRETYRLLVKLLDQLQPLPKASSSAASVASDLEAT